MNNIIKFYRIYKRKILIIIFTTVFVLGFFCNIPTMVLGSLVYKYSIHKLKLYNTHGTFWNGTGLLVAMGSANSSAPLIRLNWNVKLGIKKFIDVTFYVDKINKNSTIANIYLNKDGVSIDNLKLYLSLNQVSELYNIVKNLNLSGNATISGDKIILGSHNAGNIQLQLSNLSSGLSPVNPLGSYNVEYNISNGNINILTPNPSIMNLTGKGTVDNLLLNAKIDPSKKDKLLQFIAVMGMPQPDGSYTLKIF